MVDVFIKYLMTLPTPVTSPFYKLFTYGPLIEQVTGDTTGGGKINYYGMQATTPDVPYVMIWGDEETSPGDAALGNTGFVSYTENPVAKIEYCCIGRTREEANDRADTLALNTETLLEALKSNMIYGALRKEALVPPGFVGEPSSKFISAWRFDTKSPYRRDSGGSVFSNNYWTVKRTSRIILTVQKQIRGYRLVE